MTFTELLAELYRRTGYASSPAAEITTRFKGFLNLTHRQILTKPGMQSLRDDIVTFTTIANTAVYGLPIAKLQHIQDQASNRSLEERPVTWVRGVDPGLTNTGTPELYVPRGMQQVAFQPSAACTVYVVSTSASDTNTAYLEGIRSTGDPFATSVTMTGLTAAAFSAFTDVIEVTKFYLSAAAVGSVTISEGAP